MEKSEFHLLIKHCFLMGKILLKQSNGLISVFWTLLHQEQWLNSTVVQENKKKKNPPQTGFRQS